MAMYEFECESCIRGYHRYKGILRVPPLVNILYELLKLAYTIAHKGTDAAKDLPRLGKQLLAGFKCFNKPFKLDIANMCSPSI